jgi:hypothetical protein
MKDLKVPTPKKSLAPYRYYDWSLRNGTSLPSPNLSLLEPIALVIEQRRTGRHFHKIEASDLSTLLHWTARTQSFRETAAGTIQKRKRVISAGAAHPIHILTWQTEKGWDYYNDLTHEVHSLNIEKKLSDGLISSANSCVPIRNGTLIVMVAEIGITNTLYSNSDSLIWRDSGAIIGLMSIVSESMKLNFCPLGITGEPYISQIDSSGSISGVGMAIIGQRVNSIKTST